MIFEGIYKFTLYLILFILFPYMVRKHGYIKVNDHRLDLAYIKQFILTNLQLIKNLLSVEYPFLGRSKVVRLKYS